MKPAKSNSTVAAGILLVCALAVLLMPGTLPAATAGENGVNDHNAEYDLPAPAVVRLLTAPPPPQPLVHTASAQVALLFRQAVIPLARLARPFEGLAGYRFDPLTHTSGADPLVEKVELVDALSATPGKPRVWQPGGGAGLAYVRFSPDGYYLSALKVSASGPARLVIYDIRRGKEKVLEVPVNSAWGRPCAWVAQHSLICRLRPPQQGARPALHWAPVNIEHEGGPAPTRTYSNLLENDYEDQLFEHYFDTELAEVGIDGAVRRITQTRGMIYHFEPSPDGSLAIVRRLQPPYPRLVPVGKFPNTVEVWDLKTGERRYISDTQGFGRPASPADKNFPRRIVWKPGKETIAGFIERSETPAGVVSYGWYAIDAPFNRKPRLVATSDRAVNVFGWTTAGTPYFSTTSAEGTHAKVFVVLEDGPQQIWSGEVDDRYSNPGKALGINGNSGPVLEVDGRIFIAGDGLGPDGPRPFLDAYNVHTMTLETVFTAAEGEFEEVLAVLDADGPVMLTSRETETSPPNLYRVDETGRTALRPFANPYPELESAERRTIRYKREDGVDLSATLYTPASWDGKQLLPTLIWIYPYEYSDREHAGQLDVRAFRFHRVKGPSPLAAVLQGYAVLVNPTVPIVHDGVGMNDDYISQLVASAEAAVNYLVDQGISDNRRIAVGGRSYGAFSSANLLVHSRRFATAISMSGAYNRTLTPFGFQHEKRSFWDATDLYTSISPFFHANQIKAPILLVHGGADPNPGTPPMQARRFFHAMVGEGVPVRYVELPFEAHHYWGRESVLDSSNEMIQWLDRTIGCENFTGTPCPAR